MRRVAGLVLIVLAAPLLILCVVAVTALCAVASPRRGEYPDLE